VVAGKAKSQVGGQGEFHKREAAFIGSKSVVNVWRGKRSGPVYNRKKKQLPVTKSVKSKDRGIQYKGWTRMEGRGEQRLLKEKKVGEW